MVSVAGWPLDLRYTFYLSCSILYTIKSIIAINKVKHVIDYNYFGKEFLLFASVAVLSIFGLVELVWSSLPILTGWFADKPSSAEVATYNIIRHG